MNKQSGADPSTRRKGSGIPSAIRQTGKNVTTSALAVEPATMRKGSGLPNATRSEVEQRAATAASKKTDTAVRGGGARGSASAALRPAGQGGAATVSIEGVSVKDVKGRGLEDPARTKVGKRGAASASVKGDTARGKQARGALKAAQRLAGKNGAPLVSVKAPPTIRKGRGVKDATPTKVETCGAATVSMEEIPVRGGKGRGLEDATRTKVGKRGVASAPAKGDATRGGQARGVLKAAQRLAGKRGARFASVNDPPTRRKGGTSKDATPSKVETCGTAASPAEGDMVPEGERRVGPEASRSQAGRSGGTNNLVESDKTRTRKGRDLGKGPIASGCRGSGRGNSGGAVKPNSPKRPVSSRGSMKGLAPSEYEDVSASKQGSDKNVKDTSFSGWDKVKWEDEPNPFEWWRGETHEDKGQQKTSCGAERKERLVEASTPGAKDAKAVAEALSFSEDKVTVAQAEAAQGGEGGDGKSAEEVAAVAAVAPAAPAAPAMVATLGVAVPADANQVADVEIPTTAAKNTKPMVEEFSPKENSEKGLTKAAAAPADNSPACSAEAFQGGDEGGGEDGGLAVTVATAGTTTQEVAVPAGLHTPCVAKGTERVVEAFSPEEKEADASTESAVSPGDKVAAEQEEAIQDGGEHGGKDGQEATAAVLVAPAVMATLEVAVPVDTTQATNVDTRNVAEGAERVVLKFGPKENNAEGLTEEVVAPADKFATGQAEAVQGGENDGGNHSEEVAAVAAVASAAPAVVATLEVAVPADVGQTSNMDTPCVATGTERMVEEFSREENDGNGSTRAAASPAGEFEESKANAVSDGGEDRGVDGGEDRGGDVGEDGWEYSGRAAPAAPAAPAVVVTGEVTKPTDVSEVDSAETVCLAEGGNLLVGALAADEQGAQDLAEASTAPAVEFEASQVEAILEGENGGVERRREEVRKDGVTYHEREALAVATVAAAAPAVVVVTGEVAAPTNVGQVDRVETACAVEGMDHLAEAATASPGDFGTDQAEAVLDGGHVCGLNGGEDRREDAREDSGEYSRQAVLVAPAAPAMMVAGIDVGQLDSVETACLEEGAKPLVGAIVADEQGAQDLGETSTTSAGEFEAGQAEAAMKGDNGGEERRREGVREDGWKYREREAPAAAVAPAAVASVGEVAAPADAGQVDSVKTAYEAEGTDPLVDALPSEAPDAEELAGVAASLADEPGADQAVACLDGEGGVGDRTGEQGAALVMMGTLEVAAPAVISRMSDVRTPDETKSAERMVETFSVKEQAAAALANEPGTDQAAAFLDGEGGVGDRSGEQGAALVVMVTLGVDAPAAIIRTSDIRTFHETKSAERMVGAYSVKEQAATALADRLGADQAAAFLDGEGGVEDRSGEPGAAVVVMVTLDVSAPGVIIRTSDVITFKETKSAERMMEALKEQDAEAVVKAATPSGDFAADQVKVVKGGEKDCGGDGGEAAAGVPATLAVVETREVAVQTDVGYATSEDTQQGAGGTGSLARVWASKEQDEKAVGKAMVDPAHEFVVGQAEAAQNSGEECVETASAEMPREGEEQRRGRGWWKRLVASSAVLMLTIMLGVVGTSLFHGFEKPLPCRRKTVLFEDDRVKPGECKESDRGSPWFGWVTGFAWKSRLSVSEDGGTYLGLDSSKVSRRNVVREPDVGGGVLCLAERLVRKVARLGDVRYGASPRDADPLPGAGLFCHVKEPPSSSSVLSLPRRGTARFSEDGDLEDLNSGGKVLSSAQESVDLHRADENSKDSPDVAKVKHV